MALIKAVLPINLFWNCNYRRILSLSFLCLVISGCSVRGSIAPPDLSGLQYSEGEELEFLTGLSEKANAIHSFRALTKTKVEFRKKRESLRHALAFDKPDRLLIQLFPPGGSYALNMLTIQGDRVLFIDTVNREAFSSNEPRDLLEEMIGINIDPVELMDHLVGTLPAGFLEPSNEKDLSIYVTSQDLLLVNDDNSLVCVFDTETHDLKKFQKRKSGGRKLVFEIVYDQYRELEGQRIPNTLVLYMPRENLRIFMNYSSLKINSDSKRDIYDLQIPAGYRELDGL